MSPQGLEERALTRHQYSLLLKLIDTNYDHLLPLCAFCLHDVPAREIFRQPFEIFPLNIFTLGSDHILEAVTVWELS